MCPERIVCLTEETTETLYLLEEDWRIVGISGYTERPPRAKEEKAIVSAYTTAQIEKIVKLQPDLVLGFSDLQGDIAAELIKRGISVHVFNQRTVAGIFQMVRILGGMIGCTDRSDELVCRLESHLDEVRIVGQSFKTRPRVLFEEWDDPLISGISWVSELIELAGGEDCFSELSSESLAKNRIVDDLQQVVTRRPDIIIGSWCGKPFQPEKVVARPGWKEVPAVVNGQLHELPASLILQPGPAPLTDGVAEMQRIFRNWDSEFKS